jgi:hypothetical protein
MGVQFVSTTAPRHPPAAIAAPTSAMRQEAPVTLTKSIPPRFHCQRRGTFRRARALHRTAAGFMLLV